MNGYVPRLHQSLQHNELFAIEPFNAFNQFWPGAKYDTFAVQSLR